MADRLSLDALIAEHLAALVAERRASPYTVRNYEAALRRFASFLEDHLGEAPSLGDLDRLRPADFRSFLARRHAEGVRPQTLALDLSAVKTFMTRLAKTRGVSAAAALAVRSPRAEKPLPRPVDTDDALRLSAAPDDADWTARRDRALFALLYGAGLRISEALALDERDAPLPEMLTVRGKGGKERMIPVLTAARDAVEDYRAARPGAPGPDDPLFVGARGGRLGARAVQKAMAAVRGRLGLPETATPHALRHAFATDLLREGVDLRSVQELLGHASLAATQRYTKVEASRLIEAHRRAHPRGR